MCVTLKPNIQSYVIMKLNSLFSQPLGSAPSYHTTKKQMPVPLAIPIAMAAASLGSSIFGGLSSASANRRAKEEAREQKDREDALLRRRRNERYLDTADGQALMTRAREFARDNWKKASGQTAVTGGTAAAEAMAKDAGNKMVGDAISRIAAADTARKDGIDAEQLASDRAYSQQAQAYEQQRGQNMATVAGGVSNALMSGASLALSGTKLAGGNNGGTPVDTSTPHSNPVTVPVGNLEVGGVKWHDDADRLKKLFTGAARTTLF